MELPGSMYVIQTVGYVQTVQAIIPVTKDKINACHLHLLYKDRYKENP